jgi:DNA end-binding protein Ku
MRDRQNLGALRIRDGVIALERMYFADEIRPADEIAPEGVEIDKRELQMASQLIETITGHFEPEKYDDTYRDALCEIIRAKRKGEEPHVEARPKAEEEPPDLLSALRASVEAAQGGRAPARSGNGKASRNGGGDGDLEGLSRDELYERAKKRDIKGRSDMSKDELVAALRAG